MIDHHVGTAVDPVTAAGGRGWTWMGVLRAPLLGVCCSSRLEGRWVCCVLVCVRVCVLRGLRGQVLPVCPISDVGFC